MEILCWKYSKKYSYLIMDKWFGDIAGLWIVLKGRFLRFEVGQEVTSTMNYNKKS